MSTRAKVSTSKEPANASTSTLSAEQLRRKAKFQLLGSAVLVALGVVVFAVLLDTPPRPNTNEVSVLIPARDSLPPLALPSSAPMAATDPPAGATTASGVGTASAAVSSPPTPSASAGVQAAANPPAPATPSAAASSAKSATTPTKAVEPALAAASSAPAAARYVVQVGAFTDPQKIRDLRAKLERVGLKSYAQAVQTSEGQRTRVRVGPFATKAEAEKAAAKIKSLDLPAALLTL